MTRDEIRAIEARWREMASDMTIVRKAALMNAAALMHEQLRSAQAALASEDHVDIRVALFGVTTTLEQIEAVIAGPDRNEDAA